MKTHQHNSSSKFFKFTPSVSRCILPCQHRQTWTHPHRIFAIWFYWSVSFFICPASEADQFYIPAPVTEIYKLTSASESKQCSLDSIPILFLKLCFDEVGPILTNLVNLSLSGGIFPSSFKQALVQPLLKTISIHISTDPSLSTDDLSHFRPISNLNFISKMLEKSLPPTFDLTCPLTLCLFLNLLTGFFILLELLFLKFAMTLTL